MNGSNPDFQYANELSTSLALFIVSLNEQVNKKVTALGRIDNYKNDGRP